jgi:RNA polymerase subunit RPABC4/transcription elongation factor Spt4
MAAPLAYFGISSNGVNLFINLLLLFVVIMWIALVYWTRADARRRLDDPLLVLAATAASLFPFVGTLVYMIVRPPEYLDDAREREIEIQASQARLAQMSYRACPYCGEEVEKDFVLCPSCHTRLREPCEGCQRPLDMAWSVCPYCETPVAGALTGPRRTVGGHAHEAPPAP